MFVYFSPIGTRLQIDDRSNQKTRIKRNKSLHNLIDGSRVENVKHHVWNKHPTEPRSVLGLTQVSRSGTLSNVFSGSQWMTRNRAPRIGFQRCAMFRFVKKTLKTLDLAITALSNCQMLSLLFLLKSDIRLQHLVVEQRNNRKATAIIDVIFITLRL